MKLDSNKQESSDLKVFGVGPKDSEIKSEFKSKMSEQNALYLVKHSDLEAKNFNKICVKIVQKVLKWPLQYVIFSKFSWGARLRTSHSIFYSQYASK